MCLTILLLFSIDSHAPTPELISLPQHETLPSSFSATSVSLSSCREGMYVFGSSSTNPPPRRDEACTSHGLTDRALATAPRHRTTSGSSFSRTAWDRCGSKRVMV